MLHILSFKSVELSSISYCFPFINNIGNFVIFYSMYCCLSSYKYILLSTSGREPLNDVLYYCVIDVVFMSELIMAASEHS